MIRKEAVFAAIAAFTQPELTQAEEDDVFQHAATCRKWSFDGSRVSAMQCSPSACLHVAWCLLLLSTTCCFSPPLAPCPKQLSPSSFPRNSCNGRIPLGVFRGDSFIS